MISKSLSYRLLWAFWTVLAVPAFVLSFWLAGEPPLWPHFSNETTFEGFTVWAAFAAFYGLPIFLLSIRNAGREGRN